MSLKTGVDYLAAYRDGRMAALNQEQGQRWFTSEVSSLAELGTTVFDRTPETLAWQKLVKAGGAQYTKLQAERTAAHFLARCHRDIRTMYAARSTSSPRSHADIDRLALSRVAFAKVRTEILQKQVEADREWKPDVVEEAQA